MNIHQEGMATEWNLIVCSPIQSVTPVYEGKTILKLGIYPKLPVPEWESFAVRRQEWEKPYEGCIQYKTKSKGEKLEE